jgi:hypothetical protein
MKWQASDNHLPVHDPQFGLMSIEGVITEAPRARLIYLELSLCCQHNGNLSEAG